MTERDDAGVATVYACLGIVVLLVVLGLGLHLGAASLARQRAETGADRVDVLSCSVVGTVVLVEVSARAGSGPLGGNATGRARAGPVTAVSGPPG